MRDGRRLTVGDALAALPGPNGERWVIALARGTIQVEMYAPRGKDPQGPHTRDELYVVVSGSGDFLNGGTRHRFGPGDLLFVPAGVEHRFQDFGDDFATWVIFYGPEGGEAPPAP
ncbi:MAG TPA: cupin domain-containing protein [Vicinamibacteria bacterium]|nr:cupin domain-containing protein [Vicinamibacteria bacterium]